MCSAARKVGFSVQYSVFLVVLFILHCNVWLQFYAGALKLCFYGGGGKSRLSASEERVSSREFGRERRVLLRRLETPSIGSETSFLCTKGLLETGEGVRLRTFAECNWREDCVGRGVGREGGGVGGDGIRQFHSRIHIVY